MRWKEKKKVYPSHGDTRVITKFLWFPKTIMEETRWLEFGTFEQSYNGCRWNGLNYIVGESCWMDRAWRG